MAIDNKFGAGYAVGHGGYDHLMASSARCSAGPPTGYAVPTGRSRSPMGPFADDEFPASVDAGWSRVRRDPGVSVGAGRMRCPVLGSDLVDGRDDAAVLLSDGRVRLPAEPSDHLARRRRPDGLTG